MYTHSYCGTTVKIRFIASVRWRHRKNITTVPTSHPCFISMFFGRFSRIKWFWIWPFIPFIPSYVYNNSSTYLWHHMRFVLLWCGAQPILFRKVYGDIKIKTCCLFHLIVGNRYFSQPIIQAHINHYLPKYM